MASKASLLVAGGGIALVMFMIVAAYGFVSGMSLNLPEMVVESVSNVFGKQLAVDHAGRTNILLIGTGGGEHDGPNLTDTMIVASLNHDTNSVALLSVPRDLYVVAPKIGGTKINGIYDYALKSQLDFDSTVAPTSYELREAMFALRETIERVTGVELQYHVKVDFQGFEEMVDLVGGVEVDVPYNFLDRAYPDGNYGYETFFLRKGLQTLDGETALKYARSRHSTNDFDRASRQHVLMKAVLEKALSKEILMNPSQLRRMFLTLSSNISTDLDWREILRMSDFARKLSSDAIASVVLHDDPSRTGGLLYSPNRAYFNGLAVLLPQGASPSNPSYYKNIQFFSNMYFNSPIYFSNPPEVLVLNGTTSSNGRVAGVAGQAREELMQHGLDLVHLGDAPKGFSADTTTYYFLSDDGKDAYAENLELFIPGDLLTYEPVVEEGALPTAIADSSLDEMLTEASEEYDVVIIIGDDYKDYLN